MTPNQHRRYWQQWGKIRRYLITDGEFSREDADAERGQIHLRVLGKNKSSKDLTNADLDKIFPAFSEYLVLIEGPGKKTTEDQPRKRLIFAIEKLGLDDAYLNKICLDQFKNPNWKALPMHQLGKFRFTATSRARAKKKADSEE